MKIGIYILVFFLIAPICGYSQDSLANRPASYQVVDTGVRDFYNNTSVISEPKPNEPFFGQDAHYKSNPPSYSDNGDGTITDNVTGLLWQKDMGEKLSYDEANQKATTLTLAGFSDWRVPTIKELYSLIRFTGQCLGPESIKLFIDDGYFNQPIGDTSKGERQIDGQTWSATQYVGRTMRNDHAIFGVNFVDGRIKGYPKYHPRTGGATRMYFRMVRGNPSYGQNQFIDNGDGTISDLATGLMWQQSDSKKGLDWKDALAYAQNAKIGPHDDWRLPNAKELQSIVDYSRSVQTSGTAAIDPVFKTTQIKDPEGEKQFPYFWTGTVHMDGPNPYESAVYIAFGAAQGKMHGRLVDAHGAGAQRSDPKEGNIEDYPQYFGPQGDVRVVYNFVRCVRDIK